MYTTRLPSRNELWKDIFFFFFFCRLRWRVRACFSSVSMRFSEKTRSYLSYTPQVCFSRFCVDFVDGYFIMNERYHIRSSTSSKTSFFWSQWYRFVLRSSDFRIVKKGPKI